MKNQIPDDRADIRKKLAQSEKKKQSASARSVKSHQAEHNDTGGQYRQKLESDGTKGSSTQTWEDFIMDRFMRVL